MDRRGNCECAYAGAWTIAALVALLLAALSPLGLASGEAADLAAGAFGVRRAFVESTPLADIFARLAVLIPIGEMGTRTHAVAAIGGVVALALLATRLRAALPSGVAMAVWAGVALVGLCRPFLEVVTVRPVAAIDVGLLVAIAFLLDLIRRDPTRSRVGLGLALACGLAAGAGWPIRVAVWPMGVGLTIWALRRGERWPLVAPILFVAGTGVVLGGVASASSASSSTVGALLCRLVWPPSDATWEPSTVHAALIAVANDVGALPLLVAALGSCVLLARARAEMIFSVIVWATTCVAALMVVDVLFARLVMVAALAFPVAAAIAFFAQSFGRARGAVEIVLAVVVVVPPAILGVGGALASPVRRIPNVVARRLDAAVDLRTTLDTGNAVVDREAARWRRYRRAIELGSDSGW